MTKLTINISNNVARGLMAEAALRKLSVEQVAAERVATSSTYAARFPTPARPPVRKKDPESVIGSFADRPDLLDAIHAVINDRTRRFAEPA